MVQGSLHDVSVSGPCLPLGTGEVWTGPQSHRSPSAGSTPGFSEVRGLLFGQIEASRRILHFYLRKLATREDAWQDRAGSSLTIRTHAADITASARLLLRERGDHLLAAPPEASGPITGR